MDSDENLPQDNPDGLDFFLPVLTALGGSKLFSTRELVLLAYYCNPASPSYGNGARSAERAGFTGKPASLAVQASRTLRKAREVGLFGIVFDYHGCSLALIARRLCAHLGARRKRVFITKENGIIEHDAGDDYGAQLAAIKVMLPLLGLKTRGNGAYKLAPGKHQVRNADAQAASEITLPNHLTPGERELQQKAGAMDPRARLPMREIIALQEDIIRGGLCIAEMEAAVDEAARHDGEKGDS